MKNGNECGAVRGKTVVIPRYMGSDIFSIIDVMACLDSHVRK